MDSRQKDRSLAEECLVVMVTWGRRGFMVLTCSKVGSVVRRSVPLMCVALWRVESAVVKCQDRVLWVGVESCEWAVM
eukprot:2517835-Rhodomonas_salina.1